MTRSHVFVRQIGPLARLGLVEMPIPAKTFVAPVGRLWYKAAVTQRLTETAPLQTVRNGYGPRIPRPSGAGVIGHHANNGKGR